MNVKFLAFIPLLLFSLPSVRAVEIVYAKQTYTRGKNFFSGSETLYKNNPTGLSHRSTRPNKMDGACKANLMSADQAFSLSRMREIGYLTEVEYDFYMNLASSLETEQVTFFHQYREFYKTEMDTFPAEEIEKIKRLIDSRLKGTIDIELDPNIPFDRQFAKVYSDMMRGAANPRIQVKDASLYLVRGQGWDRYLKRRIYELPWMKETGFKGAPPIDRFKTGLIWELGRAAKVDEGNAVNLLKLTITEMAEEARIYGVDPAETLVFAHARDRQHKVLYERAYGFKIFAESSEKAEDFMLAAPLSELLKRNPETNTILKLKELEIASGGVLSGEKAARAQSAFRQELMQALDFREGESLQSKPIVLFNDLYDMGGFVGTELNKLGVPEVRSEADYERMMKILKTLHGGFKSDLNLDESMIADDLVRTTIMAEEKKALRIYNIDPAALKESPDLVLRTLLGVRAYYLKKVERFTAMNRNAYMKEPIYSIITTDKTLCDHATALGGTVTERPYQPNLSFVAKNEGKTLRADGNYGNYFIITFNDSQIAKLSTQYTHASESTKNLFHLGKWNELYRLHTGAIHF